MTLRWKVEEVVDYDVQVLLEIWARALNATDITVHKDYSITLEYYDKIICSHYNPTLKELYGTEPNLLWRKHNAENDNTTTTGINDNEKETGEASGR